MKINGVSLMAVCSILISSEAIAADIDLNQYYLISGRFGQNGARQPEPAKSSIQSANAIFNAMDVTVDEKNQKKAGIVFDGETLGLTCSAQTCHMLVVIHKTKKLPPAVINGSVQFSGAVAKEIFNVLPSDGAGRVGASTHKVANISCQRIVAPNAPVTCSVKNIILVAATLEEIVQQKSTLDRSQAEDLVRAAGLN